MHVNSLARILLSPFIHYLKRLLELGHKAEKSVTVTFCSEQRTKFLPMVILVKFYQIHHTHYMIESFSIMSEHLLVRVILLDLSYVAQRKDAIAFLIILWNIATTSVIQAIIF